MIGLDSRQSLFGDVSTRARTATRRYIIPYTESNVVHIENA